MRYDETRDSKSADNNKSHILAELRKVLPNKGRVLEIASGTGQHAVYFSENLPGIEWHPSDMDLQTMGLEDRVRSEASNSLQVPILLNVDKWPDLKNQFDAVFSANCVHIISESQVENYVLGVSESLKPGGLMLLYGPFKYDDEFTTPSNESFDGFLKKTYPGSGIRDFAWVNQLADRHGLHFILDTPMPANNQFMVWRKETV